MPSNLLIYAYSFTNDMIEKWEKPISDSLYEFCITGKESRAMFLSQIMYESVSFTRMSESLNFSVEALKKNFSRQLSPYQCEMLGRSQHRPAQEQAIANIIYQKFNGNINCDDGWRFRGRGLLPIKGRQGYLSCGQALGLDFITNPELLEEVQNSVRSAAWLWKEKRCDTYSYDMIRITHSLTGGIYGLKEREALFLSALDLAG